MGGGKKSAEAAKLYFGMQAEMGLTKHMGGRRATDEMARLCGIGKGSYVLDVGCGTGKTACYLGETIGCRVVGVDLYEGMVKKSKERAERKGLAGRVKFRVADAQKLPFRDNTFDAVICESVTAFLKDKQQGINEYVRVAKKGGYAGINEVVWIGEPDRKVKEYMARTTGADFLKPEGWQKLLKAAGLKSIRAKTSKLDPLRQFMDEISWLELRDFFGPWHRVLSLFIRNRKYRDYLKGMLFPPLDIGRHIGHGIYSGKK
jgi:ubiquinone/menaquinone biosynthesis C-methylase UbiE